MLPRGVNGTNTAGGGREPDADTEGDGGDAMHVDAGRDRFLAMSITARVG